MAVTFEFPDGDQVTLDEERATFLADSLRARASGEDGKIAKPERARALADAVEAHASGTATNPVSSARVPNSTRSSRS